MVGKLGIKLRRIRESLGLTQEELSRAVGLTSEFISMLEIGKRAPSLDSLKRIAGYLNKDIGFFLQDQQEDFDSLHQDKKLSREAHAVIRRFQRYCEDYMRLEDLTSRRVEPAPTYGTVSAEILAQEERRRLGLGDAPIRDIFAVLEINGLRILRQAVPDRAKVAAVFVCYEAEQSAFVLINASQPLGDQVITAAHAYGHYLKDRYGGPILDNPDIFVDDYLPLYHPREKFAQSFAMHFMVPTSALHRLVSKDKHGRSLGFEDVVLLKRYFGLRTATMLQILHRREFIPSHRYHEFMQIDSAAFERSLFGVMDDSERVPRMRVKSRTSDRYRILGVSAYQKVSRGGGGSE